MDDRQLIRYSRHILLANIDLAGQTRLLAGRVLLIGAGGLGSPAALYLASAGVGQLTVCDGDVVDLTNLQRQIVHREATIGMNKAQSAQRTLAEINPDCRVVAVNHRVDASELLDLVGAVDVVVDGSDNFPTRQAVNRACVIHRKPLVSGAAIRYAGQLMVYDPRVAESPCYHCLFPQGEPDEGERCATMGVFAPLTGVIGSLQAGEAIRLLLGEASPLATRLLLFDAQGMAWQSIAMQRNPVCPVCASHRSDN